MGQYFYIANTTKKEYIHPHKMESGLKLWEICANNVSRVLPFLLRQSNEGGGGDIRKDYQGAGRWAGDNIVVIGDYDQSGLYYKIQDEYTEISSEIIDEFNDFIEIEELKCRSDKY